MTFGPCWQPGPSKESGSDSFSEAQQAVVRQAAQRLVAELEAAAEATRDWADQELGFALVSSGLSSCLADLAELGYWGKANQTPSSELWRVAGSWLELGELQHRARFKPHGYAGDYEMLRRIWEYVLSDHPLGRLFDRYFQSQAAVVAVRNRIEQTAAGLVAHRMASRRGDYHILSVGSGPAIEIELAVRWLPIPLRSNLRVTLLDLDAEALEHARGGLARLLAAEQIVTVRENLFRLPTLARAAALVTGADFSLCTGLFDYLEPAPAAKLLELLWNGLNPGGLLLVGNFAPHCPTRAYMEWLGNWYLLYRTPAELAALARAAGLPDGAWRIGAEHSGSDLFLEARA